MRCTRPGTMPLVSILIPAYNARRWVASSIRSALDQTWPRKEIIVVDDGSRDDTLGIARRFQSRSVKVVSQQNRGASAARNRALSLAQGDYIQWLDADNLLTPGKVAAQVRAAERIADPRVLLSSAWARFFFRTRKAEFIPTPLWADLQPVEWLLLKLERNLYMIPEVWLVSRELTESAGPWRENLSLDDDGEYFARVLALSHGTQFVSEARSYYRYGIPSSLSSVTDRQERKLRSQFLSMQFHITYLLSMENSARARAACLRFLQRWFVYFYPEQTEIVSEAREIARQLGGELHEPELRGKYAVITRIAGLTVAKHLSFQVPRLRLFLLRNCDLLLHLLSRKELLKTLLL